MNLAQRVHLTFRFDHSHYLYNNLSYSITILKSVGSIFNSNWIFFLFRSGSELKLSPEMPVLKPETKLIDQNKAVSQKSDGDASNIHLEENLETKEKLNDKIFRRLRERKFEDKSSHFAASVRKKKSRKGKEKSEIEFAIKSHKKKKLRLSNKFTPIKRKLRKNFKFYNEQ